MDVRIAMASVMMSMGMRVDFMIPVVPIHRTPPIPEIWQRATPAEVAYFNLNPVSFPRDPFLHHLEDILMAGPTAP